MLLQPLIATLTFGLLCQAEVVDRQKLTYAPLPEDSYTFPKQGNVTTLLDLIKSHPDLSTLAQVLEEPAGFAQAFDTIPGWDFTFFAPSNQAFENTGQYFETYAETLKGKWWLGDLLQHHYIPNSKLPATTFNATETRIQTGTYMFIKAQKTDGVITLNDVATVTEADVEIERGIIHVIDHILDPSAQVYNVDLPRVSQRFIAGSCSNPLLPYC